MYIAILDKTKMIPKNDTQFWFHLSLLESNGEDR